MEVRVDTLHILQCDLLAQNHLVERANEERVEEATMEDGETNDASNELEVVQMLGIDT